MIPTRKIKRELNGWKKIHKEVRNAPIPDEFIPVSTSLEEIEIIIEALELLVRLRVKNNK